MNAEQRLREWLEAECAVRATIGPQVVIAKMNEFEALSRAEQEQGAFDRAIDIAKAHVEDYKERNQAYLNYWNDSPFKELVALPPKSKGAWGEQVVIDMLEQRGYTIESSTDTKVDCVIVSDDRKFFVEIKTSFLWSNTSSKQYYKFQQVRLIDNYDLLLCLGVSKDGIKVYPFTKSGCVINGNRYSVDHLKDNGVLKAQHSEKNCWFTVDSNPDAKAVWHATGYYEDAMAFVDEYLKQ